MMLYQNMPESIFVPHNYGHLEGNGTQLGEYDGESDMEMIAKPVIIVDVNNKEVTYQNILQLQKSGHDNINMVGTNRFERKQDLSKPNQSDSHLFNITLCNTDLSDINQRETYLSKIQPRETSLLETSDNDEAHIDMPECDEYGGNRLVYGEYGEPGLSDTEHLGETEIIENDLYEIGQLHFLPQEIIYQNVPQL